MFTSLTEMIVTEAATFIFSVGSSMFIAGVKWGKVTQQLEHMTERLAKIEGMFVLRLKDDPHDDS